jgi:hypothetical protein
LLLLKKSEDYQIITKVAKEEVDSILENKKVLLSLAIVSVVDALKNDPNTKLLLSGFKEEDHNPIIDNYCNSLLNDPMILQIAEEIYDKVSNVCIQNTMNWTPINYQQHP